MSKNPKFMFCVDDGLDESFLPTKAEELSTGYDVKSAVDIELFPFDVAKISLGIRAFIDQGWWLELRPRSSSFAKKNLSCLYGVIDESYENSILFACQYIPPNCWHEIKQHHHMPLPNRVNINTPSLKISKGESIGQLVPVKRQDMDVLSVDKNNFEKLCADRGAKRVGGFGSTDIKK